MYIDAGHWDIAKCLSEEYCANRLENYLLIQTELGYLRVRELQASGGNATKLVFVTNLGGFTLGKHASVQSN